MKASPQYRSSGGNALAMLARLVGVMVCAPLLAAGADTNSPADSPPGSTLTRSREAILLRNGDLLYGALDSIDPASAVHWRHPDAAEPINFLPDSVTEIHLPARPRSTPHTVNSCRLQLSNNDLLEGDLVVSDKEKAVLKTWYAGEVTVPHKMIQAVLPVPPDGAVLYQGPTGLEGWTVGKVVSALGDAGEWKYRNGAFYATNAASIARKLSLPDVAKVEFDLAWKGLFQLAVAVYTDYLQPINLANKDTEPSFGGFYSLQINSFSANLLPVKKNDPLRYLGQVSVPAFNQKNAAHLEIRASKPKRTISLLVDGQLVKQWTDTEDFAGQGTGMRFVHQGQGKVKLSNLRITEWDGQNDDKPAANPDGKQDVVRLRNGDKVTGDVDVVRDGKVVVSTGNVPLTIPLNRVKQIEFAGKMVDKAAHEPGNVRATFSRGGAVTFQLEKWEGGKVLGTSPMFGKMAFDATAFSRVELQLKAVPQ